NAVAQPVDGCTALRELEGRLGKVDSRDRRTASREVDRVGADAAADLEHALPPPTSKVGEPWDVRLDEVPSPLDLVEVLTAAHRLRQVGNVAGPSAPVRSNSVQRDGVELGCDRRRHSARAPRPLRSAVGSISTSALRPTPTGMTSPSSCSGTNRHGSSTTDP